MLEWTQQSAFLHNADQLGHKNMHDIFIIMFPVCPIWL